MPRPELHTLTVGAPSPDFALPSVDGELIRLSELRGRWVVLVFLRFLG
jgi:peroxiredoxin